MATSCSSVNSSPCALPTHFNVCIGPHTVLPVKVYDYHYCIWSDQTRKKQQKQKNTNSTTEKPVYTPWYTVEHEKELYRILKSFLYTCLFKKSGSEEPAKKKQRTKKESLKTCNTSTATKETRELTVSEALSQTLSTDRKLQTVRGNNIQFTYQFVNTSEKSWILLPNLNYKNDKPKPILIAESDEEQSKEAITEQHSLDIDLDEEGIISQEESTSDSDKIVQEISKSKGKNESEDNNAEEKDEDNNAEEKEGNNVEQEEERFISFSPWKYSLNIFLEPYSPDDSSEEEVNKELISYYLKR
jgi:hypothetical protein